MPRDSRLSRMLHVLIHLDEGAATSDRIAAMLRTNPVVVRRTLGGLRDHGLVLSEKGHGGGWRLARPLAAITLMDVHRALGSPPPFAIGPARDDPRCLVEQAVNAALAEALARAEAVLTERLAAVTLAEVARDFAARNAARTGGT